MMAVLWLLHLFSGPSKPAVLRPFRGRPLKELPQFGGQHAEGLLWGTFRPGFYFGMRMRQPRSLLVGLMWVDPHRHDPLGSIRHEAQQGDGLSKYGWLQHDGQRYGLQQLLDGQYNISTAWAKHMCADCGPGGDWGVSFAVEEVKRANSNGNGGQPRRQAAEQQAQQEDSGEEEGYVDEGYEEEEEEEQPLEQQTQRKVVSLFVYVAAEDGSPLAIDPAAVAAALQQQQAVGTAAAQLPPSRPAVSGRMQPLGGWQLHLRRGGSGSGSSSGIGGKTGMPSPVSVHYLGLATPHMHNLTEAVHAGLVASLQRQHAAGQRQYRLELPDLAEAGANLAIFQMTAQLPVALDLSFLSGLLGSGTGEAPPARLAAVSSTGLQQLLAAGAAAFEQRFDATFGSLAAAAGTLVGQEEGQQQEGAAVLPTGTVDVSRAALSNMLGGMGYFYGHSLVRQKRRQPGGREVEVTSKLWDTALYSVVPSRSFFPRGFLWDEGFHQLLIRRWSPAMSRDVLGHWFDLMNAQGWIAREQILGEEARARVPSEFVQQSPDAANPPTFFLLLSEMSQWVATAAQSGQWDNTTRADAEFLKAAWPRMRAWYLWFNTTQAGPVPGSYRWRGRDAVSQRELNPKTLTSGLDDAPRASHPSDEERHLDLRCWMALATRSLATVGSNLGLPTKEVRPFLEGAAWLEDFGRLNELHWDEGSGEYRDWGNHTEDVELQQPVQMLADGRRVPVGDMQRVVTGRQPRPQLVPQYGYISLFPLLMRLIPATSPILGRQLDLLRDEDRLWTHYGLRSLSRSASLYQARNTQHDPPYWRSAIWVNINYMAVQALRHYGATPGPHQARASQLHQELRGNLLTNIVRQYRQTGYLWEQYNDAKGQGKGSHPFTGWTALVVLLAADQ